MSLRLRLLSLSLALISGSEPLMAAGPQPLSIRCVATGARLVTPPLAADELCRRFVAALGRSARRPAVAASTLREGIEVELTFRPHGAATASAARVQSGRAQPPLRFDLAVSDRGFRIADIERLAADVAHGMLRAGR